MSASAADEFYPLSGLNALLDTAASNSPDHLLVEDDEEASTAAVFAARVRRLSAHLQLGGLARGERVLIAAGAQVVTLVALVATLRAGLEPVLVPCQVDPDTLAVVAVASKAAALIGPTRYAGLNLGETYLSTAASAETIRGILTHGPDRVDGAADISLAALDALRDAAEPLDSDIVEMPTIATIAGPPSAPTLVSHRQVSLFADALSLVEQARITPARRLVSLLPPTTLAGLVGGPFAAFVGASRLVLHGPFSAQRLLRHLDAERGAHLVAPVLAARCFAGPALDLSSLIVVSRHGAEAFALPETLPSERPIVDLYAFGEDAVLAQSRENGEATPPIRAAVDLSLVDGLGARLNRARAEHRLHGAETPR